MKTKGITKFDIVLVYLFRIRTYLETSVENL